MEISDIIALGALLLAAVLGVAQYRLQRRVEILERERREEEVHASQRAEISADATDRDKHGKRQLCLLITNKGPAIARQVDFDPDIFAGALIHDDEDIPIPQLHPGQSASFDLALAFGSRNTYALTVKWEDTTGERSEQFYVKPL